MGGFSKLTGRPLPASAKVSNMLGWLVGGGSSPAATGHPAADAPPPPPHNTLSTQARIVDSDIESSSRLSPSADEQQIGEEVDSVVEGSSLSPAAVLPPPAAFSALPKPQPRRMALAPPTGAESQAAAASLASFRRHRRRRGRQQKHPSSPLAQHIYPPTEPRHPVNLPFIPSFDVPLPKVSKEFLTPPPFPPMPKINLDFSRFWGNSRRKQPAQKKTFRPSLVDNFATDIPAIPTNNVLYYMDAPDLSDFTNDDSPLRSIQDRVEYRADSPVELVDEAFNEIDDSPPDNTRKAKNIAGITDEDYTIDLLGSESQTNDDIEYFFRISDKTTNEDNVDDAVNELEIEDLSLDIDHDEAEENYVKLTDLFESTKLDDEIPDDKDTTTDLLKESLTEEPNVMEIEEVFKDVVVIDEDENDNQDKQDVEAPSQDYEKNNLAEVVKQDKVKEDTFNAGFDAQTPAVEIEEDTSKDFILNGVYSEGFDVDQVKEDLPEFVAEEEDILPEATSPFKAPDNKISEKYDEYDVLDQNEISKSPIDNESDIEIVNVSFDITGDNLMDESRTKEDTIEDLDNKLEEVTEEKIEAENQDNPLTETVR